MTLSAKERMLREITEKQWSADLMKLARYCGWDGYHTYRSDRSPAGFPDWTLWKPGQLIFVELKRETGVLSPKQEEVIAGLRLGGGRVYVWRPHDLEAARDVLAARI